MASSPGEPPAAEAARLCAGDWVEVRSRDEILATLDERGRLDGLPFMPQILRYCGTRAQVFRRAHKTCDTVHKTGGRRMKAAVHLAGVRCDGEAYGGCQAACLIFWKEAWLRRIGGPGAPRTVSKAPEAATEAVCSEKEVGAGTRAPDSTDDDPTYVCQATMLPQATTALKWWDLRQYWEDYRSGNATPRDLWRGACFVVYFALAKPGRRLRRLVSPPFARLYDWWQSLWGGIPFPRRSGAIPAGQRTPAGSPLGLQPGDLVRVKPYREILATLDTNNRNKGLYFDAEEVPYCGGTYRVRARVERIIDEKSGKMLSIRGGSVILEGVYCRGWYSDRRMFCPRAIYPIWREVWLERAEEGPGP